MCYEPVNYFLPGFYTILAGTVGRYLPVPINLKGVSRQIFYGLYGTYGTVSTWCTEGTVPELISRIRLQKPVSEVALINVLLRKVQCTVRKMHTYLPSKLIGIVQKRKKHFKFTCT